MNSKSRKKNDAKIGELHRQIGQLKVENDNLSRKLGKRPFCGSRGMRDHLRRLGCKETLDRFLSAMRAIAKEAQ